MELGNSHKEQKRMTLMDIFLTVGVIVAHVGFYLWGYYKGRRDLEDEIIEARKRDDEDCEAYFKNCHWTDFVDDDSASVH